MRFRFILTALIIAALTAAVVLTGCKRAPEEGPSGPVEPGTTEDQVPLSTISFPVANSVIGISVKSAPAGLVATFNEDNWIELTDSRRPRMLYTFVANDDKNPRAVAPSIDAFENDILGYDGGAIIDEGSMETALGNASWAAGTYSEDGETIEKIYLLAPHPSGVGSLTVTSICPSDTASVDERLARIRDLLKYVG